MKREGVGWESKAGGDVTGGHSFRPRLNQKAENVEPIFLCQRGQNFHSVMLFHVSIKIEILIAVKEYFKND